MMMSNDEANHDRPHKQFLILNLLGIHLMFLLPNFLPSDSQPISADMSGQGGGGRGGEIVPLNLNHCLSGLFACC